MKKYGVIGFPLEHSMSPFIHKELFSLKGIEVEYEKYEIAPERLLEVFDKSLKELDGFNITIPHKLAIMPCCDEFDESALEYGAVNVIENRNGKYIAYNTDAYGFLKGLEILKIPLEGRVLVYGFGGAARTIITECLKADCEVFVGTTEERRDAAEEVATEIANKLGKKITVLTNGEIKDGFDLLINASPVGMYPKVEASPITEEQVELFKYVYDIVYNPSETELLRMAKEKGKLCGGGMTMLVCQAVKGHELWYGAKFTDQEVTRVTELAIKEMERSFCK